MLTRGEQDIPTHPACLDEEALLRECTFGRERTSGPGGQHRNKVETAVVLTHRPSGVAGQAGERRSVRENRPVAIRRLRLKLATEVRTPVPLGEARSALWLERCRKEKIVCNAKHWDYPALVAEALDMLAACSWDGRKAAVRLCTTTSQLVKFLQQHPPALAVWNEQREAMGKGKLK